MSTLWLPEKVAATKLIVCTVGGDDDGDGSGAAGGDVDGDCGGVVMADSDSKWSTGC